MTEPEATFSACFGSAFLMWHPVGGCRGAGGGAGDGRGDGDRAGVASPWGSVVREEQHCPSLTPFPPTPHPPAQTKYASMLAEKVVKHGTHVWLINTGWTGGPYGVGYRFKLRHTRAIVDAIHSGELGAGEYETMPIFNLQVGGGVGGCAVAGGGSAVCVLWKWWWGCDCKEG